MGTDARALDYSGTVSFQGSVSFSAPIPGIALEDLVVSVDSETEATGNGEQCSILASSSDNADLAGNYPSVGQVDADMLLHRGGPMIPDGACIVTVRATGTDGVATSARGSQTVFVQAAEINTSATLVVPNITVRESKAIAGVDSECTKWVKKQLRYRAKCNYLLLKKGPTAELQCKDAGLEPPSCDDGQHVEATLALAHDSNDQQTDPPSAEAVDLDVLKDQVNCQKRIGKAAALFVAQRVKLVDVRCVEAATDTDNCRDAQTNTARKKLEQISKCVGDQMVDGGTGRIVPDVAAPCDVCIDGLGAIDNKCLRSCLEIALTELSDGIVGDIPVCGNGILQPPEFCDDGNTADGDGCDSECAIEPGP
jgi:cysteine-rich repeat protein